MKNLIGCYPLLKILTLLLLFSLAYSNPVSSQSDISETAKLSYTIDENGSTSFKYTISLESERSRITAISKYTILLPFKELDFYTITADGENLRAHREVSDNGVELTLDLEEKILSSEDPIEIALEGEFKTPMIEKAPKAKILVLPGSISGINVEKAKVKYPKSFGPISNLSQEWQLEEGKDNIKLEGTDVGKAINLIWGEKVTYDFGIEKTLVGDPSQAERTFDLNVPKSHFNQKVLFSKIEPTPDFAYQDAEGNVFFSYKITAGTEIDIHILGQIEISLENGDRSKDIGVFQKPILTETKGYWLLENEYELNRLEVFLNRKGIEENNINQMDAETKKKFYKEAYTYTIDRLSFGDFKKTSLESYTRQGASHVASNRRSASPEDYVDFLSAIYRKYSVPTRMLEGYVNVLDQGFYHSWLEYWNEDDGWITIDPSLEDYSGGSYFKRNLPNHVVIISRGFNYIRPRMAFFDKNEFSINLAKHQEDEYLSIEENITLQPLKKNYDEIMGILEIKNKGNSILSMKDFANQEQLTFSNHNALQVVVPGQTLTIPFLYKTNIVQDEDSYLEYQSINGERILKPFEVNIQEETYWWWSPFVSTLKYTVIVIIVYVLYLTSQKIFRWIEKYYQ